MFSTLLTLVIIGVVALVVLSVVGTAVGLLFKLAPLVLIGYIAYRILTPKRKEIPDGDRKWLES
ncbi:MAG: hypothetical protein L0271_03065 [Gemmatimonadetes bacterium]|nr:hypothetical protein [Gemmatimonadota bacterium]